MIVEYIKNKSIVKIDLLNGQKEEILKNVFIETTTNDNVYNVYSSITKILLKQIYFKEYDIFLITITNTNLKNNVIDCITYDKRDNEATLDFNNFNKSIFLHTIENAIINFNYNTISLTTSDLQIIYIELITNLKQIIIKF